MTETEKETVQIKAEYTEHHFSTSTSDSNMSHISASLPPSLPPPPQSPPPAPRSSSPAPQGRSTASRRRGAATASPSATTTATRRAALCVPHPSSSVKRAAA